MLEYKPSLKSTGGLTEKYVYPEESIVNYKGFKCGGFPSARSSSCQYNLIQNSQAVKKECGPQKGYGEKICEIQPRWRPRNGCDGSLMVKILITTIQVNLVPLGLGTKFP